MPAPCGIAQRIAAMDAIHSIAMVPTSRDDADRADSDEPLWVALSPLRSGVERRFDGSHGECFAPFALAEVDDVTRERPNTSHPVQPTRATIRIRSSEPSFSYRHVRCQRPASSVVSDFHERVLESNPLVFVFLRQACMGRGWRSNSACNLIPDLTRCRERALHRKRSTHRAPSSRDQPRDRVRVSFRRHPARDGSSPKPSMREDQSSGVWRRSNDVGQAFVGGFVFDRSLDDHDGVRRWRGGKSDFQGRGWSRKQSQCRRAR
jgi:hypothetical protein